MNFMEHHDNICRETLHHYKTNELSAKLAYEVFEEKLYNIVRHHRNQGEEDFVINQMTQLGQEILRDKYITNLVHHLKSKEQTIYASYGIINRLSYSLQSYIKSLCYLAFYIKEHHIQKLDNLYKNYFKFDILQLSLAVDPRITYILQNHSYMREHLLIKFCHRYQLNQQMFYIYQVNQYTTYYQAFNMEFIQEDNNDLVSNEFARVQQSNPSYQQTQSAYQQPQNYQNSAYQQSPMNPYPINQSTINQPYNYNSQYQPPQYPNSQINYPASNMQQPYANMYQQQSNIYTPSQNQYNPNYAYPPSPGIQSGMQPGYPVYPPSPGMQPGMQPGIQPGMQPGIQQNSGFQPNPQLYNTGQQYSNNQMVQPSGYQQNAPAFQPVLQSFSQPQPNIQQQQITNTYIPNQVPNNPVPYNSQQQPVPYQNQQQIPTNNPNNQQQYQLQQQPQINNQVVEQNNQQQQTNNLSIQIPINQQIQQQVEANQQQQQNINNQGLSDQQQQQAQDNIKQSPMTQTIILTPEPELQQSIVIKKSTNVEYQESNNQVQNEQPQEAQATPQQNLENVQSEQQQQQLQQEQEQIQQQEQEQEQKQEQKKQPESSLNTTQQQQEQFTQQGDLKSRLLDESVEFISTIKPNQQIDFSNSDSVYIIPKPESQIQIIDHKSVCEQLFQIRKPQLNPISIKEDGLIPQIKLTQTNLIQNRQVETPYNLDESALSRMERRIQSQKYQKVDYDQFIKQVLIDW